MIFSILDEGSKLLKLANSKVGDFNPFLAFSFEVDELESASKSQKNLCY